MPVTAWTSRQKVRLPFFSSVPVGHPHRLRANRVPAFVPVPQLHAVGRDTDDPEPAPAPRPPHIGAHPNPGRRLVPLTRRDHPDPVRPGARGWAPHRTG